MKKIEINNCIGCGACVAMDPEHFEFDDNLSTVKSNDNLDSEALQNAIASCPVGAIKVTDDNTDENNEN